MCFGGKPWQITDITGTTTEIITDATQQVPADPVPQGADLLPRDADPCAEGATERESETES